jgi:pimeloyl-ACP methyl ester carboxylesterase
MGSVFSELVMLLFRNRCRPSAVTSLLTFYPPEPAHYRLTQNADGRLSLVVDRGLPQVHFPELEIHKLTTSRGDNIVSFLYRFPGARYTVLFSHGNAADCGSMQTAYVELCQRIGVNVFAYDYTGYGSSSGTPSEAATYADIEAAYDFLVSSGVCTEPDRQIVLYGQSVGSGPSVKLASSKKRPVRAMVLHSPIMSGLRVIMENRGPLCCCDPFPNIRRIRHVTAPVLVIHGDADVEVSFT